MHTHIL